MRTITFFFLVFFSLPGLADQPMLTPSQAPRYVVDDIIVKGNGKTATHLILAELLIKPGDLFEERRAEFSRYRLLGTGLFSKVSMRLEKSTTRGHVLWILEVVERNTILVSDLFLTTSPEVPVLAGFGIVEENFFGQGLTVESAFVAGTDVDGESELALQASTISPRVGSGNITLSATALYTNASEFFADGEGREIFIDNNVNPAPFAKLRYQRLGGELGLGFELSPFSRFRVGVRIERLKAKVPFAVSAPIGQAPDERIEFDMINGNSTLTTLEGILIQDTRDHPFLPTRGSKLFGRAVLGTEILGGSYNYGRFEAGVARWQKLPWGHVLKGEVFGGIVLGDAPFFEHFYLGDFSDLVPKRQLGIAPSVNDVPNVFSSGIDRVRYADFSMKATAEYAVPLRQKAKNRRYLYGMDMYFSGGFVALSALDDLLIRSPERPFGVPFDLTVDIGVRIDTLIGIFGLSFSNAIGIVP